MNTTTSGEIIEKHISDVRIAGIRWKGPYRDTGKYIGRLARVVGRHVAGKPFNLYYDHGCNAETADIESCFPVHEGREIKSAEGITIRVLSGGAAVSLLHQGPYDQLCGAYATIAAYLREKNYEVAGPPREIYLKGPGIIFRGNPKKYLTEIQFLIK